VQTDVLGTELDRYPKSEAEHNKLVSRVNDMFTAADNARRPYEVRWKRFYRLWRSYVQRRQGDWRSKVFLPHVFYIISTILPRMTAALPKMLCLPVEELDVDGARNMEDLLEWSAQRAELDPELICQVQEALMYGTGILKTKVIKQEAYRVDRQPQTVPTTMPFPVPVQDPSTGQPMTDLNGQPLTDQVTVDLGMDLPVMDDQGNPVQDTTRTKVLLYQGPAAEAVDLFDFYVAPEATSIDDARYVIQRYWRSRSYIEDQVKAGAYRKPEHLTDSEWDDAVTDPKNQRASEIGMLGSNTDPTREGHMLHEVWTDDTVITVMDLKYVLRVADNPYAHGQKPYVRIVDNLDPHCFWGIGEIEIAEGMQDLLNALVNQRIDNVRLLLNAMFIIDTDAVQDLRDLQMRPGGVIRTRSVNGVPAKETVQRLDFGEVTSSAFEEAGEAERLLEKFTGVNGYTGGADPQDTMNQTATGAAIISDQGNSRFSHKVRMAEIMGYRRLARQFGTLLQQYMPDQMTLRVQGDNGAFTFKQLTPTDVAGGFDYDIEAESATTTDTIRRDQAMSLFQTLANDPLVNQQAIIEDLLRTFGKKDIQRYMAPPPAPMGQQIDPTTGQPVQIDPTTGQPVQIDPTTGQPALPDATAAPPIGAAPMSPVSAVA
jgi:hypothetical protein